ncbi:MAG: STAS domain-containing protein [Spirochaetes bacterium]|nr:STAS domain-containing protein [Spirochaetota bacterium]
MEKAKTLYALLSGHQNEILRQWQKEQLAPGVLRSDLISPDELKQQMEDFLRYLVEAVKKDETEDMSSLEAWKEVRSFLTEISKTQAKKGFLPSETSMFIFSLKKPIFQLLQSYDTEDLEKFASDLWKVNTLLDQLGLLTMESYLKSKEEIIRRQQEEMLELSTPVVKIWEQVVAVPLIGTLDSARTQMVMENLLQEIVRVSATIAIIDITGVPTVDTLVAQHLFKTVSAARLMGAECVISGIRPQIAQTMVHLGVSFQDITTKATLAEAIKYAFSRVGYRISKGESTK